MSVSRAWVAELGRHLLAHEVERICAARARYALWIGIAGTDEGIALATTLAESVVALGARSSVSRTLS